MEIAVDNSVKSNIQNAVEFKTTSNSSKLFSMLSSFLYSDKELAVLHELSSNAIDAHKMVGKDDVPIEITLPTSLAAMLIVRDHGPGLSPDDVVKFLTTYGESNKQDSNEFVGGYGIGSKSPAAVTDTWNVISRHAGVLSQYLVVIGRNGVPSLTKLREEPTTETGLEVQIPVMPQHMNKWYDAASNAFKYYKVRPILRGNRQITYQDIEYAHKHEKYQIVGASGHYSNIVVISGNRGYTLDKAQIKPLLADSAVLQMDMVLPFNIGELELDLSREKLRYSQSTIDAIAARLTEVTALCKLEVETSLAGLPRMEYIIKASELYESYGSWLFILIRGNPYNVQSSRDLHSLSFDLKSAEFMRVAMHGKIAQMSPRFNCGRTYRVTHNNRDEKLSIKLEGFSEVHFVKESDKTAARRARQASLDNRGHIYVLTKDFSFLGSDLAHLPVDCTTLPLPPAAPRVARVKIKSELYVRDGGRFVLVSEVEAKQFTNVAWTTITNATSAKTGDVNYEATEKLRILAPYCKIIGVKKGSVTFCKSVTDKLKELVADYEKDYTAYKDLTEHTSLISSYSYVAAQRMGASRIPKTSALYDMFNMFSTYVKPVSRISSLTREQKRLLDSAFDLTKVQTSLKINQMRDLVMKCNTKYPMLQYISSYYMSDEQIVNAKDYIVLVDSQ